MRTLAAISTIEHAGMLSRYPADAVVVLQTTDELQVSFPSFAKRQVVYTEIRNFLEQEGDEVCVMPILAASEKADFSGPALLRPEMLS